MGRTFEELIRELFSNASNNEYKTLSETVERRIESYRRRGIPAEQFAREITQHVVESHGRILDYVVKQLGIPFEMTGVRTKDDALDLIALFETESEMVRSRWGIKRQGFFREAQINPSVANDYDTRTQDLRKAAIGSVKQHYAPLTGESPMSAPTYSEEFRKVMVIVDHRMLEKARAIDGSFQHLVDNSVGRRAPQFSRDEFWSDQHIKVLTRKLDALFEVYGQVLRERKLLTLSRVLEESIRIHVTETSDKFVKGVEKRAKEMFYDWHEGPPPEKFDTDLNEIATAFPGRLEEFFGQFPTETMNQSISKYVDPSFAPPVEPLSQTPEVAQIVADAVEVDLPDKYRKHEEKLFDWFAGFEGQYIGEMQPWEERQFSQQYFNSLMSRAKEIPTLYSETIDRLHAQGLTKPANDYLKQHSSRMFDELVERYREQEYEFFQERGERWDPSLTEKQIDLARKAVRSGMGGLLGYRAALPSSSAVALRRVVSERNPIETGLASAPVEEEPKPSISARDLEAIREVTDGTGVFPSKHSTTAAKPDVETPRSVLKREVVVGIIALLVLVIAGYVITRPQSRHDRLVAERQKVATALQVGLDSMILLESSMNTLVAPWNSGSIDSAAFKRLVAARNSLEAEMNRVAPVMIEQLRALFDDDVARGYVVLRASMLTQADWSQRYQKRVAQGDSILARSREILTDTTELRVINAIIAFKQSLRAGIEK
jgi:hypothetical protein